MPVTITGGCSKYNSAMGYQFIENGDVLTAKASLKVYGEGDDEEFPEIAGSFYTAPDFKCRCGNTHLYQCKACGKFICYDGKEQKGAYCPVCHAKNDVPAAAADGRIMCSGHAAALRKVDIVLAIDTSVSMAKNGRMDTVKRAAINEFVSRYEGSRMALVSFGGQASVKQVLTSDLNKVKAGINALKPDGGTVSPFATVLRDPQLEDFRNSVNDRYLVVFTDGEWSGKSEGNVSSARKIKDKGIKILSIGCAEANAVFLKEISSPDCSIVTSDEGIGSAFATIAKKSEQ